MDIWRTWASDFVVNRAILRIDLLRQVAGQVGEQIQDLKSGTMALTATRNSHALTHVRSYQ